MRKLEVYFDKNCSLCRKVASFLSFLDFSKKLLFIPLQEVSLKEVAKEELEKDLHVKDQESGRIYRAVEAYREIFFRIAFLYPLGVLLRVKPIYLLGEWIYKKISRNRTCSLQKSFKRRS